jgi:L-ascorbate metabolism protein UlaG (beta-lactamase superfamily)
VSLDLTVTYVGGPTALLEFGGLRLLTDPTFDPAGHEYPTPAYTLRKTAAPALGPEALGRVDVVLLSHDHHFDNLDTAGRAMLSRAGQVLTTPVGAARLGLPGAGLEPWETVVLRSPSGPAVHVTGTPARHGPAHADRGPVTGFALWRDGLSDDVVYVSGDTVWFEGVAQVAGRFRIRVALLFVGAARVGAVGPWPLTFTAREAVEAAGAFGESAIVPLHFEGWEHFSESRQDLETAFADAGLSHRLRWPEPGRPCRITG